MIVVSDASPLTNLAAIGRVEILRRVYGRVLAPEGVAEELREGERRGDHPPIVGVLDWLEIHEVQNWGEVTRLREDLDRGEAEAIVLASEKRADFLLMDERAGRRLAAERGLATVGLIGTLLAAKNQGFITAVRPLLDQLIEVAGFWVDRQLYHDVLRQAGE